MVELIFEVPRRRGPSVTAREPELAAVARFRALREGRRLENLTAQASPNLLLSMPHYDKSGLFTHMKDLQVTFLGKGAEKKDRFPRGLGRSRHRGLIDQGPLTSKRQAGFLSYELHRAGFSSRGVQGFFVLPAEGS